MSEYDEVTELSRCRDDIARLTAEVATLRQRCGRLVNEVQAWRRNDEAMHICHDVEGDVCPGCISYRAVADAREACDTHNDLTQGGSDGQ